MTSERDQQTRLVLSWLREDLHEDANRVLVLALDEVDATPQRRSWWPAWRSPFMPTYAKFAAAAAALVVVAFVGYQLIPGPGPGPGGSTTPSPTASPAPAASTTSATRTWPPNDSVALVPGDYVTGDPFPVRLTATVPAGWHGWIGGPYYVDLWFPDLAGGLYFLLPSKVSVDPCDIAKGFADVVGPTVDDLVQAVRTEPGLQVTNEATTSISGFSGTQFLVTAPASTAGCTVSPDGFVLWQNPLGGTSPELKAGDSIRVWILDVAGNRLVIVAQDGTWPAAKRTEVQGILDSIRIEPAT